MQKIKNNFNIQSRKKDKISWIRNSKHQSSKVKPI